MHRLKRGLHEATVQAACRPGGMPAFPVCVCVCRGAPVLAEDQYSDSIRRLGEAERKAEEQSDFAEKLLRKDAEAGMAEAQYTLAEMHLLGHGVPQDCAEARRWYEKGGRAGACRGAVRPRRDVRRRPVRSAGQARRKGMVQEGLRRRQPARLRRLQATQRRRLLACPPACAGVFSRRPLR